MDLKTKLVYQWAKLRLRAIEQYQDNAEQIQLRQLRRILERTARTDFGRRHGIEPRLMYRQFAERTPVADYELVKADVERMVAGEADVLVPGKVKWYAKSSGTTNDKSKYIPVPYTHLQDCHYRGGSDALWLYLRNYTDTRFFSTKGLVLGGSHAPVSEGVSRAGDLSSILVQHMPKLGELVRVPSTETLLMSEWGEKMKAVVREVAHANVGSLSGVPSWMMVMLKDVLAYTGASNISEVWPNLEVFFHGGISFEPYREAYRALIPSERMRYEETYNASEGFFAIQDDPNDRGMRLMLDYGVFYEFLPLEQLDESGDGPLAEPTAPLPIWEVQAGVNYAMLITTLGGLHRYLIGDTVEFTSLNPYRIVITGRTKHFINAFGEELMVGNADKALAKVCQELGAKVSDYTAAPYFYHEEGKGRHDWLVEFEVAPSDLALFAERLDKELQSLNSDYEAKRYQDITLRPLSLTVAPTGLFHRWLDTSGKLGGQHKVPRLANSRKYLDQLLGLMAKGEA